MATRNSDEDDVDDPVIRMNDPLLEKSIPEGEPQMFAALRYCDVSMVERQMREGFDINSRHTGDKTFLHMLF